MRMDRNFICVKLAFETYTFKAEHYFLTQVGSSNLTSAIEVFPLSPRLNCRKTFEPCLVIKDGRLLLMLKILAARRSFFYPGVFEYRIHKNINILEVENVFDVPDLFGEWPDRYILPRVKLEFVARSKIEPKEDRIGGCAGGPHPSAIQAGTADLLRF